MLQALFVFGCVALVMAVAAKVHLRRRREALERRERAGTPFEMSATSETPQSSELGTGSPVIALAQSGSASVPPPSPAPASELKIVKSPSRSPREELQSLLAERCQQGLCIVCDAPATKPVPKTSSSEPWFEAWFGRKYGAIPQSRVVIDPSPATPPCLCHSHHEVAMRHLEEGIANMQFDRTRFLSEQREAWLTFQRYGLFERMLGEQRKRLLEGAPAARRGRSKTKLVSVATGTSDT